MAQNDSNMILACLYVCYATFIPTILSLVLTLPPSKAKKQPILAHLSVTPLDLTVKTGPFWLQITPNGSKRLNNDLRVFIYVLCNFYPYYPLFGFDFTTLQGEKTADFGSFVRYSVGFNR
jgi:hypothetical protein